MESIEVYISGEDFVTIAVIKRLLEYVSPRFSIIQNIPARGGEIKKKVLQCNALAEDYPVVMLLDVDNSCAPDLKNKLMENHEKKPHFLMNISVDEAEAWLMADRKGFSSYFGIAIDNIPESKMLKQGGNVARMEMDFEIKSSWMLTHQLALQSSKKEIRQKIGVADIHGPTKGKEYNDAIVPFVEHEWNIDAAMPLSDSLQRMIRRLRTLLADYND